MVAVNKSLGRVEEIKRAMIKNRGKRDHKPISSHVVTLTFFPPFLFIFGVLKELKYYLSFELQLINIFMRHRHRTGTIVIVAYQPTISDRYN